MDGRPLLVNHNKLSAEFELNPEELEDLRYLTNKFETVRDTVMTEKFLKFQRLHALFFSGNETNL